MYRCLADIWKHDTEWNWNQRALLAETVWLVSGRTSASLSSWPWQVINLAKVYWVGHASTYPSIFSPWWVWRWGCFPRGYSVPTQFNYVVFMWQLSCKLFHSDYFHTFWKYLSNTLFSIWSLNKRPTLSHYVALVVPPPRPGGVKLYIANLDFHAI